jgi:hypothetical protein
MKPTELLQAGKLVNAIAGQIQVVKSNLADNGNKGVRNCFLLSRKQRVLSAIPETCLRLLTGELS